MALRIPMWWYLLPMLVGLLLAFGACGDGDSGVLDPSEQLPQMVLGIDDLPEGYIEDDALFSSNEDVALGDDEKLAKLAEQGRILGYSVSFIRGDVPVTEAPFFGVESAASLYEAEGGASDSYAAAVEEARATDWEAILGFGDTATEEVERTLADETVWIRVTGVVELGEDATPVLVIDDQILIRQGRARGFLRVSTALEGSSDRSAFIEEIAALAEQLVRRMSDALD